MEPVNSTVELRLFQRLLHAILCLALLTCILAILVMGAIITTNTLTQLHHAESWLYWLVFGSFVFTIVAGMIYLYKLMSSHWRLAKLKRQSK